ncbi:MAG: histidine phosphatase family protein [Bacteroidota bacterium]|nr:histidine phosphatase family protein [Bacteroidota bacterium]
MSSTTTICIIRHGETDWNASGKLQGREDIALNDLGRAQAIQTSRYFEREPWDIMVSSPLLRAYETAQIIASRLKIATVHVVDEIKERDYGSASGLMPDERHKRFPNGIIPDQEEFEVLRQRAMKGLLKIAGNFQGEKIIAVSHGGLINSILYTISGGEFGSFKTRLKNGCINRLILCDNIWTVDFYNQTVEDLMNPMKRA